jgi:hypothetical protein
MLKLKLQYTSMLTFRVPLFTVIPDTGLRYSGIGNVVKMVCNNILYYIVYNK